MAKTLGEYRVGTSFNPSGNGQVDRIKRAAAELIDLISDIEEPAYPIDDRVDLSQYAEVGRLKALAQTQVESAAMWAVKAATKPSPTV